MKSLFTPFLGACAIANVANGQIYVDPAAGNNSNPATLTAPVRTITHAVTLLSATPGQVIYLAPGRYTAASGEVFPITVPATTPAFLMAGTSPEGAVIVTPTGSGSPAPALATFSDIVALRDFDIVSEFTAIEAHLSASITAQLILQNIDIDAGADGLHLVGRATADIDRCTIDALDACIRRESRFSGAVTQIRSSRLEATLYGIRDVAATGTSSTLLCSGTTISGVRRGYEKSGSGATAASFENCTFYRNGVLTIPPSTADGAIVRAAGSGSIDVRNCLFAETYSNNDFLGYAGATDTVVSCIVTQASLVGLGGSFQAIVDFVDGPSGDLHLTAPSAAIDAGGSTTFATSDLDGYALGQDCAAGTIDIGADEYVHDFVYIANELTLGGVAKLRMLADPGEFFLAVASTPGVGLPPAMCGAPYLPASYVFLPSTTSGGAAGVSTVGANGVGELLSPVPNNPVLAGTTLWFQGVALPLGGAMQISRNVHVGTFES